MLAGIVVNQSIVLIDAVNQARERGLDKHEAIMVAGRARLRPILITKLTTILGLVPMALGIGEGAEVRAPMAITVIGGVTAHDVPDAARDSGRVLGARSQGVRAGDAAASPRATGA